VDVLAQLDLGSPSVRLRRARAADVAAIIGPLADDPLGAGRDGVRTAADLAAYQQAFGLIDTDPAHLLVVAEADDAVVGTMQLSFLPWLARRGALRAQIEAVRVAAGWRSRGLGSTMFGWAIGEARRPAGAADDGQVAG
jgi:GNAT superfamily N-acetyltransferase